jgi:hypothetical protein
VDANGRESPARRGRRGRVLEPSSPPATPRRIAKVTTIQDFWHEYYPEQQPLPNRIANRVLIRRIVAQADRLVTTSESTARDVQRFHEVSRERIDVLPLGVDSAVFRPRPDAEVEALLGRLGIEQPYVLSLDIFNPRKNFAAVLQAVAQLPLEVRVRLAIVGVGRPRKTANEIDPYTKSVALGLSGRLRVLDDLPAEDLTLLYSGAAAFVYPSLYEGFGMPVLEAMACGCPVITSSASSLPEVAGDAAMLPTPRTARRSAIHWATRERPVRAETGSSMQGAPGRQASRRAGPPKACCARSSAPGQPQRRRRHDANPPRLPHGDLDRSRALHDRPREALARRDDLELVLFSAPGDAPVVEVTTCGASSRPSIRSRRG